MAVSFTSAANGTAAASTTVTSGSINASAASDGCLVAGVSSSSATAQNATGVNWRTGGSAEAFTSAVLTTGGSFFGVDLWRRVGFTGATDTVTATFASAPDDSCIGVLLLEGVDQTTPIGNTGTNTTFGDIVSTINLTGADADDMCVDAYGLDAPTTNELPGTNQTERVDVVSSGSYPMGLCMSTQDGASGGSMSYDPNGTAQRATHAAMVVQPSSGVTGTGALSLPATTTTGTGEITKTGTGALSITGATAAGSGAVARTGTGALVIAASELSGSGTVSGGVTGTGALSIPGATAAGSGAVTRTGTGALVIAASELSGSGTVGNASSGTGDLNLPINTLSGLGNVSRTGSGALTAPEAVLAGSGTITRTATGALTLPALDLSGAELFGTPIAETIYRDREMRAIYKRAETRTIYKDPDFKAITKRPSE